MSTPAGWYDDGSGTTRWWDGSRWHDAPPDQGGGQQGGGPGGDDPTAVSNPQSPTFGNQPAQQGGGYGSGPAYGGASSSYGGGSTPSYGAYPGGNPSGPNQGRSTSKKGLTIGLVVALVLLLIGGVAAAFVFWPDSDEKTEEEASENAEIEEAVEALYAVTSCEEELALVTGDRLDVVEAAEDAGGDGYCAALPDYTYETEVSDASMDGDTATATVSVVGTYAGSVEGYTDYDRVVGLEFEKVDGAWLVARRVVSGTTPEEGVQAYYSAGTCEEQLETVADDRAEEIEDSLDGEENDYCANLPETVFEVTTDDVEEDDSEATVTSAVFVQDFALDHEFDDEVTTSLVKDDLGWVVGANLSEAQQVADAGIAWYTYPTCEEIIEHSIDPIKARYEESVASPESSCRHLDDWIYDPAYNVKPEVDGDQGYVEYDITGLYVGDEGLPNIGARVYVELEKIDDEWFVSNVGDDPLSEVS